MEISIIIPIYNRGYCLRKCLDSIRSQSYADWECILIDDGSVDDSLAICREYAANDARFRVYHQQNGGVSVARNKGLDLAKGTYVNFVDSDDYVEKNYLMLLLETIGEAGLVIGGLCHWHKNGTRNSTSPPVSSLLLGSADEDQFVKMMSTSNFLYGPVCKLYRRDLIERSSIRFPKDVSFGEDVVFNFTYMLEIDQIKFVQKALYNVFVSDDSLVSRPENQSTEAHLLRYEAIRTLFERKKFTPDLVRRERSMHYCHVIWLVFYVVIYKHSILSLKSRYCYIRDIGVKMDMDLVNGATCFPAWKRFLMKHYVMYWLFSEVKYMIRKIKKERV